MFYDRAYRLVHGLDRPPAQVGPALCVEVRRWLLCSLRELAHLAAAGGPLADVRAFSAITVFHRGLARIGFCPERSGLLWPGLNAAYQHALMASLHPVGPLHFRRATHTRARRVWLTRAELLSRYT